MRGEQEQAQATAGSNLRSLAPCPPARHRRAAIRELHAVLLPGSHSLYYRDGIGNISSSAARPTKDGVRRALLLLLLLLLALEHVLVAAGRAHCQRSTGWRSGAAGSKGWAGRWPPGHTAHSPASRPQELLVSTQQACAARVPEPPQALSRGGSHRCPCPWALASPLPQIVVALAPRYPLFGGWSSTFVFGWSMPLPVAVQRVAAGPSGTYTLTALLGPSVQGLVVDDLEVRVSREAAPPGGKLSC